MIYAHTKKDCPHDEWEPLYGENGHAALVARILRSFRSPFVPGVIDEPSPIWNILGLYHDMGKASADFQDYLFRSAAGNPAASVDHKTAAARWFWDGKEDNPLAIMFAYAFTGHHGGLQHGAEYFADAYRAGRGFHWEEAVKALPHEMQQPVAFGQFGLPPHRESERPFLLAMMTRMLHSALVDADWLATEAFMEPAKAQQRAAIPFDSPAQLGEQLEAFLRSREEGATGRINALRREIHAACLAAAEKKKGVYRLNVPTGGGKTLSSLSFALAHACRHDMQRVIYVIPYTSIIDQTADEFRRVLGDHNVVEHHSNLGEGKDTDANRFASENWAAPLIVTTAVQFFESLFACQNSRCRKLHNIANSVIIFDEAQTLPADMLRPCLAAMKSLQLLCGCTLVLCTATQPALERREGFDIGFEPESVGSLIGDKMEQRLAREMKRVEVEELGRIDHEALVGHFRESGVPSALFIVNLTRQAQDLFSSLRSSGQEGLFHLSARMCPAHRRMVLDEVRCRLQEKKPTGLVATRVVEAGVDVSFPVVYRDACGLDSLAQAAGRCNRHGEMPMGRVYSYTATGYKLPPSFIDLSVGVTARDDARREGEEPFAPTSIDRYFKHFYHKRGERSRGWDKAGIMPLFGQRWTYMPKWDFPTVAAGFSLIPGGQMPVFVPYNDEANELRSRIMALKHAGRMPSREDYRLLQQYSVNVYATELKARSIPLYDEAGLYELDNPEDYSLQTGLQREASEISYVL